MREYQVVDVFTSEPLQGNPAAVFTDGAGLEASVMQQAARELNLSETVFVLPADAACGSDARVRIFTPTAELPFAGHPVLGTAFVLGERIASSEVRLQTGAGPVCVRLRREGGRVVSGEMEQPIPRWQLFEPVAELLTALGVQRSELPVEVYDNGVRHAFVALSGEAEVSGLAPDMGALRQLGGLGLSCFAATGPRVRTRMFGPGLGVPEDPATGSAAGPLAVHLSRHGRVEFGQWIEVRQGVEISRPSLLRAMAEGSAEQVERVLVAGAAVIVAQGHYELDAAS